MKRLIVFIALVFSIQAFASKQENDTIPVTMKEVSNWIKEPYVNSNGKESIHYYAVYKGELVKTTKTTIEKANLCQKHGINCSLFLISKRVKGVIRPQRIIAL